MFTETSVFLMDRDDGTFRLLPEGMHELKLPQGPSFKQREWVREISAQSGYGWLHGEIGIGDDKFVVGGHEYVLELQSTGDCYEFYLRKNGQLIRPETILRICPEEKIVNETELNAMPALMSGKPKHNAR